MFGSIAEDGSLGIEERGEVFYKIERKSAIKLLVSYLGKQLLKKP